MLFTDTCINIWKEMVCKYISLLLLTFNVPLRIGKCTPGGTCTSGNPLSERYK